MHVAQGSLARIAAARKRWSGLSDTDRPGMVGRIGTLLGNHGVNLATMSLSRNQVGGTALTVLNLDTAPSEELLTEIRVSEDIHAAQVVELL
jgi:D-3-phosphoglycerate dehydrogenase